MRRADKRPVQVFSLWLRLFHWMMVISVCVLFWTGVYIGDPGFRALSGSAEPTLAVNSWFSMETIRRIHFIAGFMLIASFIPRIYGAIRHKGDRLLPKFGQKLFWEGIPETMLHYLMWPRMSERHVIRNSMARLSYFTIYILFALEICTGLAMYSQIEPNGVLALMFNPINHLLTEYQVHIVHHYIAWAFILFAIIHVYLVFRADIDEESGELTSMASGIKYFDHEPWDAYDLGEGEAPERIEGVGDIAKALNPKEVFRRDAEREGKE